MLLRGSGYFFLFLMRANHALISSLTLVWRYRMKLLTALMALLLLGTTAYAEEPKGSFATRGDLGTVLSAVDQLRAELKGDIAELKGGLNTLQTNQQSLATQQQALASDVWKDRFAADYERKLAAKEQDFRFALAGKDALLESVRLERRMDAYSWEIKDAARASSEALRGEIAGVASWAKDGFHSAQIGLREESFARQIGDLKLEHANERQNHRLDGNDATLIEHGGRLDGHDETLSEHAGTLASHTSTLANHSGRIGGVEARPAQTHHNHSRVESYTTTPYLPVVLRPWCPPTLPIWGPLPVICR